MGRLARFHCTVVFGFEDHLPSLSSLELFLYKPDILAVLVGVLAQFNGRMLAGRGMGHWRSSCFLFFGLTAAPPARLARLFVVYGGTSIVDPRSCSRFLGRL